MVSIVLLLLKFFVENINKGVKKFVINLSRFRFFSFSSCYRKLFLRFFKTKPLKHLSFLHADFAVATILISFCCVLGVVSPTQLVVMATMEVVFYNIGVYICLEGFQVSVCRK